MPNSQESKTATTDEGKAEAVELSLNDHFIRVKESLEAIAKKIPEAEKSFDPITYLIKSLKATDVLLEYKVVAHSKDGEIFSIEGVNNLPRLFDEAMLPEAPNNFENAFNSSIIRPALNAFMKYTRDKVDEFKKPANPVPSLTLNNTETRDFLSD